MIVFGGWALGRRLGSDGEAWKGFSKHPYKETPGSSLTLSAMWTHSEKTVVYAPGRSGLSPDTQSTGTLIMDFPGIRAMK